MIPRVLLLVLLTFSASAQMAVQQPMFANATTAVSAVAPSNVTSGTLKMWVRSDYGLFKDAGKSQPSGNGDIVYWWRDMTTNANDLNHSFQQPTNITGLINGFSGIRFVNHTLAAVFGAAYQKAAFPITITIVFRFTGFYAAATNTVIGAQSETSNPWVTYKYVDPSMIMRSGTNSQSITGPSVTNGVWYYTTLLYNGASSVIWTNGIQAATGTVATNSLDVIRIGTTHSSVVQPAKIEVAEIMIWGSTSLSDNDRMGVWQYIRDRYALP